MSHPFDQFSKKNYLNLETFRKNGQGVRTPVWFCQEGEVLYVRTQAQSGKVKRVRRSPRVRVAPCDMRGEVRGEWVEAEARLVDAAEEKRVNELLKRKYGFIKALFDLAGGRSAPATLAIQTAQSPQRAPGA